MTMARPGVFVSRSLPGRDPLERLEAETDVQVWPGDDPPPPEAFRSGAEDCAGVLTMITEQVDGSFLDACPSVRAVANMAVGYDNIDVEAASERGVLVTNTPGVLTDATADLAFALLLAAARRLPEGEAAIREGRWGEWHPTWMLGVELNGSTLGIIGPGRIGAAVARRGQAFGMSVIYHGRHVAPEFPGDRVSLDDLYRAADFVSVHVPLTEETTGMFDASAFARMQRHAIFINTARGGVVDQTALRAALEAGEIGGAALDVFTPEPLPPDDPLLQAPNLVISPHLGSATEATRARMAGLAVDGLLAALAGRRPDHLVNPEALEAARTRGGT
jgi:glyoxylate reductase